MRQLPQHLPRAAAFALTHGTMRNAAFAEGAARPDGKKNAAILLHRTGVMHVSNHSSEGMAQSARRILRDRCRELEEALDDDQNAVHELREVRGALLRLEHGTWGRCEKCQGAIGRDRLRAVPETRTCIDCAD